MPYTAPTMQSDPAKPHGIVYLAVNAANGKKYVGLTTKTLFYRWRQHGYFAKRGSRLPIHRALRKYGANSFDVSVVAQCNSHQEMLAAEIAAIAEHSSLYPAGYNLTAGGEGHYGLKRSAETRARIGRAHKGRKRSADQIEQLRQAKLGAKLSLAARRAISRAVIAEGIEYPTIGDAAAALGVASSTICRRIVRQMPGYANVGTRRTRRQRTPEQVAAMKEKMSLAVIAAGERYSSLTAAAAALGITRPGVAYRISAGWPGYQFAN